MQIHKSGRSNDLFLNELQKNLDPKTAAPKDDLETPKEEILQEERDEKGQKPEADKITETQLPEAGERKDEPATELMEGQLDKSRKEARAATPNADKEGTTEERLNSAEKSLYPHRNPEAYKRTGNKRPINALREEMGNASEDAKRERYDKAYNAQKSEKRVLDEDVGSQMTNKKAFNFKKTKVAAIEKCQSYIAYKDSLESNTKTASVDKFAEVKALDGEMTEIMALAQNEKRDLSHDDLAKIAALKERKSQLLGLA